METVFQLLKSRGLLETSTCEALTPGQHKVYNGIDPSADSLHLGNLIGLIVLRWFQRMGHTPVVVLGGATGMIGDPSGRSKERQLLSDEALRSNIEQIQKQVKQLLPSQGGLPEPVFLNNYDWFRSMGFIEFLRETGKHFRMGSMLAKDSVQSRLNSSEGISFTEFCYQTLQAFDFYHLFENEGVSIQCGGSDQWGNITAGCDLIAKKSKRLERPVGLVWSLLVRSDGRKFGKSEEGAVWLDSSKLSAYKFYQYALNTSDSDVIGFMKRLTFMPLEEIEVYRLGLENKTDAPNTAQRRYARELTLIVHGQSGLEQAMRVTEAAKPGALEKLDVEQLQAIAGQIPTVELERSQVLGHKLVDLMALTKLVESKAEARRLIENRGAYLNQEPIEDGARLIEATDLLDQTWLVLSAGKKRRLLIKALDTNKK